MAKQRYNHIHKYQSVKWGKNQTRVLKCMIPGCPHYLHVEMSLNRRCLCNKCGQPFVLDAYAISRKKPKCPNCIARKGVLLTDDKLADLIKGLTVAEDDDD